MTREPNWAGQFYPADPGKLTLMVEKMLAEGKTGGEHPWAVLVPHAGYPYSGETAALALTRPDWSAVTRVILLGPPHHSPVTGVALTECESWRSPRGSFPIDSAAVNALLEIDPLFQINERAHALEHSLEVQLPFLGSLAPGITLLPILLGHLSDCERERFVAHLNALTRPGDLWLVTTDLSHFHPQGEAEEMDSRAERLIASGETGSLQAALERGEVEACGAIPLLCLLAESERRCGAIEIVDRRDSSAASGDRDSVVGYLSAVFQGGRS